MLRAGNESDVLMRASLWVQSSANGAAVSVDDNAQATFTNFLFRWFESVRLSLSKGTHLLLLLSYAPKSHDVLAGTGGALRCLLPASQALHATNSQSSSI
jgi:hypothetical protein